MAAGPGEKAQAENSQRDATSDELGTIIRHDSTAMLVALSGEQAPRTNGVDNPSVNDDDDVSK